MQQEIQGKKHGFLAGNVTYYVGGFHASWKRIEDETIGLTHPFCHDLRSRGVGLVQSRGKDQHNTGLGNDFLGWEFYKDTRVLYGSVVIDETIHRYPAPTTMHWRPDRMICEYEVQGIRIREQKFIAKNDAACSIITSSSPVTLRIDGQSFFGRHSLTSTATIKYHADHNAIHIVEGGTTRCQAETDRSERIGPIMYQGMSTVLLASRNFANSHSFTKGEHGQMKYQFDVPCDNNGVVLVWAMHDDHDHAIHAATSLLEHPTTTDPLQNTRLARDSMVAKTQHMNRQLSEQIPYFRCSNRKFQDIDYYLWSLYLMYYIDVGREMEQEPDTKKTSPTGKP